MTDIRIDRKAWVLVCDGSKALFFSNEGGAARLNLKTIRVLEHEAPASIDHGSEAPGRMKDGPGPHRSAVEATDWHVLEKHRFAKDISQALYRAAHKGRFEKLVLVAPPMILGDLRKSMHKEVQDRIVGEINKTLTGHSATDIQKILSG